MKKIALYTLAALFCSCSSYKVADSLWYSVTPSELEGQQGDFVDGLYFTGDNRVLMKAAVVQDTTVLVKPVYTGYGRYTCTGRKLKKGIGISIEMEKRIIGKDVSYNGVITPKGMLLFTPDSVVHIYYRAVKPQNK